MVGGLLVAGVIAEDAHAQCTYQVDIIQAPDCPFPLEEPPPTLGRGLNELGHVVGYYFQCDDPTLDEAFVWRPETGLVTLERPPGVISAKAVDVNDAGQIVGELDISGDGLGIMAFLHDGNEFMEIPPAGGTFSQAARISNQTEVAGTTGDGSPFFKAFLWENDVMTLLLPSFGPRSVTRDMNDARQIVGWMGTSNSIDSHAFLWEDGAISDLGVIPGGFASQAQAINQTGQIVIAGLLQRQPVTLVKSFLWDNGRLTDLGILPGLDRCTAVDINDAAQVIGVCDQSANPNNDVPFIWQDGVMTDLTELIADGSGIFLRTVWSINNAGQIVGGAIGPDGHSVAVLLTPMDLPVGDINRDCRVGVADLVILLDAWGQTGSPADINGDGVVNVIDLIILLLNFGS